MTFSPCLQEQTALCHRWVCRGGLWLWVCCYSGISRWAGPQVQGQWQEGHFFNCSWNSDLTNHSLDLALLPPVILCIPTQKHSCERCRQPGELCTGSSRLWGSPVSGVAARGLLPMGCSTCCAQMLGSELSWRGEFRSVQRGCLQTPAPHCALFTLSSCLMPSWRKK